MTSRQLETDPGAVRRLLMAVVGFVIALLGLALIAGPAAAQNVVGPQPQNSIFTVGAQSPAAPENIGLHTLQLRPIASATGVAAETAPSIADANAEHIFRDAAGHFVEDSPANRQLIESVVKRGNYVRTGGGGEQLYRETLPDGTQIWAKVFDGSITNGGLNQVPLH